MRLIRHTTSWIWRDLPKLFLQEKNNELFLHCVPTIFWLDEKRGHAAQLIAKVQTYLNDFARQASNLTAIGVLMLFVTSLLMPQEGTR